MNIKEIQISKIKPYKKNAKKHPKEQVERIAKSIEQFGFVQPVVLEQDNTVVIGHGRVLGAKKAGLKSVPCVYVEGLTEQEIKALRLADNKLNESAWDKEMLSEELGTIFDVDMDYFGFAMIGEQGDEDKNKYSMKTGVPQYTPKGDNPDIKELVDVAKTKDLIKRIEESNVTKEQKQFLKFAAYRHLCFNYSKIAEYYCRQNKEMQELMEESALVIIDFNDAIRFGYVDLMEKIIGMEEEDED